MISSEGTLRVGQISGIAGSAVRVNRQLVDIVISIVDHRLKAERHWRGLTPYHCFPQTMELHGVGGKNGFAITRDQRRFLANKP